MVGALVATQASNRRAHLAVWNPTPWLAATPCKELAATGPIGVRPSGSHQAVCAKYAQRTSGRAAPPGARRLKGEVVVLHEHHRPFGSGLGGRRREHVVHLTEGVPGVEPCGVERAAGGVEEAVRLEQKVAMQIVS